MIGRVDARRARTARDVLVGGARVRAGPGRLLHGADRYRGPGPVRSDRAGGGVRSGARDPAGDDVEHALALANGTRYGLAAAVWTSNVTHAHRVARRLRAGTVWVNTSTSSSMTTPFGGFKDSGHGRDRSLHALDSYTQLKTTWISL